MKMIVINSYEFRFRVIPVEAGIEAKELDSHFHGKSWIPCQAWNDRLPKGGELRCHLETEQDLSD
jgi:hypothetical protein